MIFPVLTYETKITGASAKDLRAILTKAYYETARFWHMRLLPKHFTRRGFYEYNYERRTKKYMDRKDQKKHHQLPLVWTGDLRRSASMMRDITSNSKGAKVRMRSLPAYVYKYNFSKPVKKAEELVRVSAADERKLKSVFERAIDKQLRRTKATRSITTGRGVTSAAG